MTHAIIVVLLVFAIMAWAALIWCIVAANRGFYPWFKPLHQAGVLPANGRGPALITWRRLLANEPEEDATAEAYRVAARRWSLRAFVCAALFCMCAGLAAIVNSV